MTQTAIPVRELPKALLTIEDATEVLRLSRAQLYREMSARRLRYVNVGRARRIPATAITEFVALLEREAATEVTA